MYVADRRDIRAGADSKHDMRVTLHVAVGIGNSPLHSINLMNFTVKAEFQVPVGRNRRIELELVSTDVAGKVQG